MDIHTLQDFLTMTKGQEYLMAIGSIFLFTLFWIMLDRKPKKNNPKEPK